MEENKILEILKKVPLGTWLYSPAFGKMKFDGIRDSFNNEQIIMLDDVPFLANGKFRKNGEVMLFPSKEMRDWSKFAWKKGDVLVNNDGNSHIIFKGFSIEDYSMFEGKHWFGASKTRYISCLNVQNVQDYHIEDDNDAAQTYINTIEERFCGKLNLETLEVEKTGFKDGDILTCTDSQGSSTFIFRNENADGYTYHAAIGTSGILYISTGNTWCNTYENVKYATEAEKMKLFDALTNRRKYWNAEKKIIEDINQTPKRPMYKKESDIPEHELEPFEKVLVRDQKTDKWTVSLYGFKSEDDYYNYNCVGENYVYCIPYKGNEHLLGTTNNPD